MLTTILLIAVGIDVVAEELEFTQPVLSAAEIKKIADEYSKTIPNKSSRTYEMTSLSFEFLSNQWIVRYFCTGEEFPPGCHYGLLISNTAEPDIRHMPGK